MTERRENRSEPLLCLVDLAWRTQAGVSMIEHLDNTTMEVGSSSPQNRKTICAERSPVLALELQMNTAHAGHSLSPASARDS